MTRAPPDAASEKHKTRAADMANRASAAPEEKSPKHDDGHEHPTVASPDPRRWYRERGRVSSHVRRTIRDHIKSKKKRADQAMVTLLDT